MVASWAAATKHFAAGGDQMVACWAETTPTADMHMHTCFYDRTY